MRADLLGRGWGRWRGSWRGARRLVVRAGQWVLEDTGREVGCWDSLADAMRAMWPDRRVRDSLPWAVGFIGYEEVARLAGDFPASAIFDSAPAGLFLLEPEPVSAAMPAGGWSGRSFGGTKWSLDAGSFRDGVEQIRERIAAGDVYQVTLSRRLTVEGWLGSLAVFAEAASDGGAPDYLARIDLDGGELLCASMEMLLRRRGVEIETRPIKGTRPRGTRREEDQRLAVELDADPKERAELAMVVDLERNDLGRVSEIGSVEVADPGSVHTFAAVHHRVARVRGRARQGLEWWELLAAVAPGGSVTGCPKRAAMSVIEELEPVPRGPFTGALGVVAGNGDLEMALPIRTAWQLGSTLELAAGCGVVWQSKPAAEEEESRLKVARWLDLVGGAE
ncbi:MAG: anthranilate synthase component I family protein [Acidobacteria bacterium]|nr:anthranilate synthase component I family protein [Candidatus Sulfomarinibacter sp. MAG AM1]